MFGIILILFAIRAYFVIKRQQEGLQRNIAVFKTIYLSVPVSFAVYFVLGHGLAYITGCSPSALRAVTCSLGPIDISEWMNSLVFSGYAIAFLILPWLIIGGIVLWLLIWFVDRKVSNANSKEF